MTAITGNTSSLSDDVMYAKHSVSEITELTLYVLMLCGGITLNVTSLRSIVVGWHSALLHRRLQDARFYLLKLCLSVTHLLVLFLYAAPQIAWLATYEWLAPEWMCKAISFLSVFSFYSMSNVVVCIAADRALTVKNLADMSCAVLQYERIVHMLRAAWAVAFIASVPQWLVWVLVQTPRGWFQCSTIWFSRRHQLGEPANSGSRYIDEMLYELFHLLMLFWLPMAAVFMCYCIVCVRMRTIGKTFREDLILMEQQQDLSINDTVSQCISPSPCAEMASRQFAGSNALQVPSLGSRAPSESASVSTLRFAQVRSTRWRRTRRRTEEQFLCIIVAYMICFLPYSLLGLWSIIHWNSLYAFGGEQFQFLKGLIVANAVVNPFLYRFNVVCRE